MKFILYLFICVSFLYSSESFDIFANEYKPPKVWTEGSIHKGILVEVVKELEQELDVRFNIVTFPWARSYKMALAAKGGIVGISVNEERKKIFDYNKIPLFKDTIVLVTKKGKEFDFKNIEDLKGKKIGFCRGCSFGKTFEDAKKYFIPIETDDSRDQRLSLLLHDKIDVALIGPGKYGLLNTCKNNNSLDYKQFTVLEKPLVEDSNYIAFKKELNKKEFLKEFDKKLKEKIDDGTIGKIIEKYLVEN